MSSISSSSSSSSASTKKKRRLEAESSDSPDDQDSSDASSTDDPEEDSDAPRPLPSAEITVLSHADRRRQKKKQKQQLATTSTSEPPRKKRKLDDGASVPNVGVKAKPSKAKPSTTTKSNSAADDPGRQKRQNSIWVGNLSFRTTQDALRGFFDAVGTITRVHMPVRRGNQVQGGENMGFAYVDFETPEAKVIAITLSESHLDGRNLLIKDGDDFTGRPVKSKTEPSELASGGEGENVVKGVTAAGGRTLPKTKSAQKILRAQKQPPAPTLFLGNLGFETTEESIRKLFEAHRYWGHKDRGKVDQGEGKGQGGESDEVWIRKVRMGTFEDSGNCKGFAFVDFTSIEHATEALVNPRNHRLNGRDLVVEYASPDAVRRGGPRHPKGDRDQKIKGSGRKAPQNGTYNRRHHRHIEQDDADTAEIPAEGTTPRSRLPGRADRDRPHARRVRPGAALAHAQRQSAAILPSQGQKIVF